MTFLGYHVEDVQPDGLCSPSLASEFRRRLFCFIFNADKGLASFTGRPPLLSRRYVSTRLPLDLADAWLLSDDETLRSKVDELDEDGWSQDDSIYPASHLRARFRFYIIRDEVFEIALAVGIKPPRRSLLCVPQSIGAHDTDSKLRDLKARETDTLASLPQKLRFDAADFDDLTVGAEKLYIRLILHLEHLQNLFFIERLLCRDGYAANDNLLQVSFEMVSTAVMFWTNMDRLSVIHHDFMWLVRHYIAKEIFNAKSLTQTLPGHGVRRSRWRCTLPQAPQAGGRGLPTGRGSSPLGDCPTAEPPGRIPGMG